MSYLHMSEAELRRHLRFKESATEEQKHLILRLQEKISFQEMILNKQAKIIHELKGEKND